VSSPSPAVEIRNRIEIALSRLPISDACNSLLPELTDFLVSALAKIHGQASSARRFRPIGLATTLRELASIARITDVAGRRLSSVSRQRIASATRSLHSPAIALLADVGVMRQDILRLDPAIVSLKIRNAIELAHQRRLASGRGRPPIIRAQAIAFLLFHTYTRLTGSAPKGANKWVNVSDGDNPPPPRGPFLDLLREVFDVFQISASPVAVAQSLPALRRATRERIKRLDQKTERAG